MKVRLLALPGILVSCVVLAGCATSASAVTGQPGPPSVPPASYVGAIGKTIAYENAGVLLEVPSPTAVAVPWSDAYVNNCKSGEAICDLSQSPTIYLADVTVTSAGQAREDGSIEPLLKGVLAYVIQYDNVPCTPLGPPQAQDTTAYPCTILNFIDANSGKVLYSMQGNEL